MMSESNPFSGVVVLLTIVMGIAGLVSGIGFIAHTAYQAGTSEDFTLNRNEWACASERSIPRFSSTAILVTKKCDVWIRRQP